MQSKADRAVGNIVKKKKKSTQSENTDLPAMLDEKNQKNAKVGRVV